MFGQSEEVTSSIESFLRSVTVPAIEALGDDSIDQVGTGTLFRVAGRLFFVTARHIFDDMRPENLCIPRSPDGDRDPRTLGRITVTKPAIEDIDLAIVEIHCPETVARIEPGWRVLPLDSMRLASRQGSFVLSGYPSELGKRPNPSLVKSALFAMETVRLDETPSGAEQPVHADLDLFFAYGRDGLKADGGAVDTPHLKGASGASIWEFYPEYRGALWAPDHALKIVGVQSTMARSYDYFRAKSSNYLLESFRKIDSEMESAVNRFREKLPM